MKIVMTGGGTAGHAMVNKVLVSILKEGQEDSILYLGSHQGAERKLMETEKSVTYCPISTGKLRRYPSTENIKDIFRVLKGMKEAYAILKADKTNVVLSGGGYVSLPVVIAARILKIPVLIRETDISVGLANRIGARFASKIITTFPDTLQQLQKFTSEYGGLIIRPELLEGDREDRNKLEEKRPSVLVMGGSMGSERINEAIWENRRHLTSQFHIIHLCGKGQKNMASPIPDYEQYEYREDMAALFAQTDVMVTRCGSNAISEGLALGKRMVCIPISSKCSRGEQTANAEYAVQHGSAVILLEENLSGETLTAAIKAVMKKPVRREGTLTKDTLNKNCMHVLRNLRRLGMENVENRMIHDVQKGNPIKWEQLPPWERQLYEEIAEEYE